MLGDILLTRCVSVDDEKESACNTDKTIPHDDAPAFVRRKRAACIGCMVRLCLIVCGFRCLNPGHVRFTGLDFQSTRFQRLKISTERHKTQLASLQAGTRGIVVHT